MAYYSCPPRELTRVKIDLVVVQCACLSTKEPRVDATPRATFFPAGKNDSFRVKYVTSTSKTKVFRDYCALDY